MGVEKKEEEEFVGGIEVGKLSGNRDSWRLIERRESLRGNARRVARLHIK
jgi:hypothetical protein